MVFPRSSRLSLSQSISLALTYSLRFSYPLSPQEAWYWQPFTSYPLAAFLSQPHQYKGFLSVPNCSRLISLRRSREKTSRKKLQILNSVVAVLRRFPFIQAVYLTGSLAMNNCKPDDDIDIMIISSPHTVWLTRFLVVIFLVITGQRRPPGLFRHSSPEVANKICDNLYLSTNRLTVPHHPGFCSENLYLAHEILQSKLLWGRPGIAQNFLRANSWVSVYLPIAYSQQFNPSVSPLSSSVGSFASGLLFVLNSLCFLGQYLYMRSGLTTEKVGLEYAFFHPGKTPIDSN